MNKKKFASYLKNRYEKEIKWYNDNSVYNQRWARVIQIIILIFSVLTIVSAALRYTVLTVLFSALGAVSLTATKYFKFDELWNKYRTTCETLKKEKYAYECSIGEYEEAKDKEKLFVERVEQEISKENTEWVNVIRAKPHKVE